ncbi:MAG: tetratricopeptide repeat protein [Gemmatimonadales bacterium]|nr:tetratricopeptide repeat protein [Gemmatimonadales bacterium]MBA3553575.1 tetratricopeptide repeat protein [Gemmatimonadales bacterium]
MVEPAPEFAGLLAAARAHAAHGDWVAVRDSLQGRVDTAAHPAVRLLSAEAELRLGNFRGARDMLEHTVPALERGRAGPSVLQAINMLGAAYFELGELPQAEAAFSRALELAHAASAELVMARATNNLGLIANIRGSPVEALARYRLAVPLYQRIGHPRGLAESFHNMAISFRDLRQLDEADSHERRAIEFAREGESPQLLAMARAGRAELSLLRGEPHVAEAEARRAVEDYGAVDDPVGQADALRVVGLARLALGAPKDAMAALDQSVELASAHGSALVEAEGRRARAELLAAAGRIGQARADAETAADLYRRIGAETERAAVTAWCKGLTDSPS